MRHVAMTKPGGPEVLVLVEGDTPQPGTDEVLIRVQAAGINRADTWQRLYELREVISELLD